MLNNIIIKYAATGAWLQFSNPVEVLVARNISMVQEIFQQVDNAVKSKGYYAAGFVSYDAAPGLDQALQAIPDDGLPKVCFGIYSSPRILSCLPESVTNFKPIENWRLNNSRKMYGQNFRKIKHHIEAGDTYQVNYTLRQTAELEMDAYSLFHAFAADAPYAAFVDMLGWAICSASPELFFDLDDGRIISRPMKGTAPRGLTAEQDLLLRNKLSRSIKDQAENIMIVDMVRNDLSRIAESGSVKVERQFELEKYPTLWQLTSTVSARTTRSIGEIFRAMFPCASITGAPKVKAMNLITEFETAPRNIYTGSIGFISPTGKAQFNVAIRTALVDKNTQQVEYGVGGGIIWDSDESSEYAECLLKAKMINTIEPQRSFSLIETLLWTPEGGCYLLDAHLDRLSSSAEYFSFQYDPRRAEDMLRQFSADQPYKIRLLLSSDGDVQMTSTTFQLQGSETLLPVDADKQKTVRFATYAINSKNVYLYHKTTRRDEYDRALLASSDTDDVVFYNESGQVTESSIANIVVNVNGEMFTPPASCGLLNGTMRQWLLKQKLISERIVDRKMLQSADEIFLVNSVRKCQQVKLVE
ncbi:MAG: aminodeoxychorismate synthase component I [Pseudomonadales bacterium]|nr:aminodeoxychorismate synthase component I [Pseudomonadales bacterium]